LDVNNFSCLVSGSGASTQTGIFQIKVTDQNDKPLAGVKVVSEEQPNGQLKITGLTDADGIAIFSDVNSGNYIFDINRYDYLQNNIAITVAVGQTTSATVKLEIA
jgi:hypothetical protein